MTTEGSSCLLIKSPFSKLLDIQLIRANDGMSEVSLLLGNKHMNASNIVHGGATMALADTALAMAACSLIKDSGIWAVTIEMKVSFMQPGKSKLLSVGRVLYRSKMIAYCEGEVHDDNGRFVAKALGTFKYINKQL